MGEEYGERGVFGREEERIERGRGEGGFNSSAFRSWGATDS